MAKKVRTPPPPRRVQAPKVRTGKERSPRQASVPLRERFNPLYAGAALAALVVAGVLIGVFATRGGGGGGTPTPPRVNDTISLGDMAKLPGIQLGKPPWNRGGSKLAQRLAALGLTPSNSEQLAFHIHQHLDVFVNGKAVPVPQYIGFEINGQNVNGLAFLHTHDSSGIIHVESPTQYDYTLGQFFGVWGVRLSRSCIGGLCGKTPLKVYVDGVRFTGDPTRLVLTEHEEIAIVSGTPPAKIPTHYKFASGL